MTRPNHRAAEETKVASARDLLVHLYRDIGISAVAAAVAMSRQPGPEAAKRDAQHELPACLRDQEA